MPLLQWPAPGSPAGRKRAIITPRGQSTGSTATKTCSISPNISVPVRVESARREAHISSFCASQLAVVEGAATAQIGGSSVKRTAVLVTAHDSASGSAQAWSAMSADPSGRPMPALPCRAPFMRHEPLSWWRMPGLPGTKPLATVLQVAATWTSSLPDTEEASTPNPEAQARGAPRRSCCTIARSSTADTITDCNFDSSWPPDRGMGCGSQGREPTYSDGPGLTTTQPDHSRW